MAPAGVSLLEGLLAVVGRNMDNSSLLYAGHLYVYRAPQPKKEAAKQWLLHFYLPFLCEPQKCTFREMGPGAQQERLLKE